MLSSDQLESGKAVLIASVLSVFGVFSLIFIVCTAKGGSEKNKKRVVQAIPQIKRAETPPQQRMVQQNFQLQQQPNQRAPPNFNQPPQQPPYPVPNPNYPQQPAGNHTFFLLKRSFT